MTMFFLHKLLPLLFLPQTLLLAIAAWAICRRRRGWAWLAVILLGFASTPFFGKQLMFFWERRIPGVSAQQAPAADAILVCSGMSDRHPVEPERIEWSEAVDRFEAGVRLYRLGKASRLVFFEETFPGRKGFEPTEASFLRQEAMLRGVPEDAIILLGPVRNTMDEARMAGLWMRREKLSSAILVTTAWHMPRALRMFDPVVPTVHCFPADYFIRRKGTKLLDYIPQSSGLRLTELVLREWMGIAFYFFLNLQERMFPAPLSRPDLLLRLEGEEVLPK